MQKKAFSFAVGALLLSAGAVSAATLTDNLNLRSGPGLRYDVIGAVPAGSDVRVSLRRKFSLQRSKELAARIFCGRPFGI